MAQAAAVSNRNASFADAVKAEPGRRDADCPSREKNSFVQPQRFPYTSGHVMIVPYAHVANSMCEPGGTLGEMMELGAARLMKRSSTQVTRPEGTEPGQ